MLRNESGVSINFWESDTTLQLLNKFSRVRLVSFPDPELLDPLPPASIALVSVGACAGRLDNGR